MLYHNSAGGGKIVAQASTNSFVYLDFDSVRCRKPTDHIHIYGYIYIGSRKPIPTRFPIRRTLVQVELARQSYAQYQNIIYLYE